MGKWVGGMRLVKDRIVLRVEAKVEVEVEAEVKAEVKAKVKAKVKVISNISPPPSGKIFSTCRLYSEILVSHDKSKTYFGL